MTVMDEIRGRVCANWLARRCKSGQLSVRFSRVFGSRLLVNLDRVRPRVKGPICDYLFFGINVPDNRLWVVPVEFKAGDPRPSEVIRQLSGGARYAESLLGDHREVMCFPVVVFGGKLHEGGADMFNEERVPLFQRDRTIVYTKTHAEFPRDALRLMKSPR